MRFTPPGQKQLLQLTVAVAGLVPVGAGLSGVIGGAGLAGVAGGVSLDSHVRYLSGLLLAIELLFWSAIPAIERRTALVRTLTLIVVVGGLARAYGIYSKGLPSTGMRFALLMELAVTPALCLWQARVARASA